MYPGEVVLEGLAAVGREAFPDVGRKLKAGRLELRDEVVAAPFPDVLLAHLVVGARAERLVDGVEVELAVLHARHHLARVAVSHHRE